MEQETKKFLGTWDGKRFVDAGFEFSAHCNRVPVRASQLSTAPGRQPQSRDPSGLNVIMP